MQHAFLIIAHNNWRQLKKLIQLLDAENHDIYIHIDKKSRDFREKEFLNITKESKISIFQEYEVFWGGFSQVQVELFLFEKAHALQYDYYHLISGADLPLKCNRDIDLFFEKNNGMEYVLFDEDKLKNDPEITRRAKYYHFLQNYRRRYSKKWKNNFFSFLERVLLVIQIVLHVNRVKDLEWTIKYGSNWVSITNNLVTEILKQKAKIIRVFSCTNCADELFVQTVAYNCGFRDKIYSPEDGMSGNVRFIDWIRGQNGNPYTFRGTDEKLLQENRNLFARKFSETVDSDIIQFIYTKIQKENEWI
ncbi:MAG: beta-1,6-N-acetylglucosaminyltransferase [Lachnospiraceae bacterium]